ncbi:unnamed protein product [Diutina catenulata]
MWSREWVVDTTKPPPLHTPSNPKWAIEAHNPLHEHLPSDHKKYASSLVALHRDSHTHYLLISIYSPCEGLKSHGDFHRSLYDATQEVITSIRSVHGTLHIILGGDFNYDPERSATKASTRAVMALFQKLAEANGLVDSFTAVAPPNTHAPTNKGRKDYRLDRLYISPKLATRQQSFALLPKFAGTHHGIGVTILTDTAPGLTLGTKRYVLKVDNLLTPLIDREFRIPPPSYLAAVRIMRATEERTRHCRRKIADYLPTSTKPPTAKRSFEEFKPKIRPTFFHTLRATATTEPVASTTQMLDIGYAYFSDLYKACDDPQPEELEDWLSVLEGRCLNDSQSAQLERPFTLEELATALASCNGGAAPGSDGITISSLKAHWNTLGPLLVEAANMLQNGRLPHEFQDTIITLIQKREDPISIKDYRPISLNSSGLNVIARAMNERVLKFADTLIGRSQRGFLPGRQIDENTTEVLTLIRKFENTATTGLKAVILLDQTKAFDRVSHPYLEAVLRKLGFGPKALALSMSMTQNQHGRLEINRTLGKPIQLSSGVRQGNPYSPTLYILSLEPLLSWINKELTGVPFTNGTPGPRCCAFADDVAIILNGESDQLRLRRILDRDARMSNSRINASKTIAYTMSPGASESIDSILGFKTATFRADSFKYLGVTYKPIDWGRFKSLQYRLMSGHDLCSYPPHLRAQTINSLVYSKMVYRDLTSPISTEDIKDLEDRLQEYFFPKIHRDRVYGPISSGGYGLISFQKQLLGRRAKMIFSLFLKSCEHNWAKQDLLARLDDIAASARASSAPQSGRKFLSSGKHQSQVIENSRFSEAEKSWLTAWFSPVRPRPSSHRFIDGMSDTNYWEAPSKAFEGKYDRDTKGDKPPVSVATFRRLTRKCNSWMDQPKWIIQWPGRSRITNKNWKQFWQTLSSATHHNPWEAAILWEFYHGYLANWEYVTQPSIECAGYATFYYQGCTLCAMEAADFTPTPTSPPDWLSATPAQKSYLRNRLKSIKDGLGGFQHLLCTCPVSSTIYSTVNHKNSPFDEVSDMFPPNRLTQDVLFEMARFFRAVFLLRRETRLSNSAPVPVTEGHLKEWIKNKLEYIKTGRDMA